MEEIKFNDIERVTDEMNFIELKGKKYAEVKERVIAFRKLFPTGCIKTEMVKYDKDEIIFKASAYDTYVDEDGCGDLGLIATGYARGKANKFFSLEDTETSAVGRCLGFLALGIHGGIASAEEIKEVEDNEIFDEPIPNNNVKELADEFRKLYSVEEQARILNGLKLTRAEDIGTADLQKYINFKKYGKQTSK